MILLVKNRVTSQWSDLIDWQAPQDLPEALQDTGLCPLLFLVPPEGKTLAQMPLVIGRGCNFVAVPIHYETEDHDAIVVPVHTGELPSLPEGLLVTDFYPTTSAMFQLGEWYDKLWTKPSAIVADSSVGA